MCISIRISFKAVFFNFRYESSRQFLIQIDLYRFSSGTSGTGGSKKTLNRLRLAGDNRLGAFMNAQALRKLGVQPIPKLGRQYVARKGYDQALSSLSKPVGSGLSTILGLGVKAFRVFKRNAGAPQGPEKYVDLLQVSEKARRSGFRIVDLNLFVGCKRRCSRRLRPDLCELRAGL